MGRNAMPIRLHIANGNRAHLTEAEIERRLKEELTVPFVDVKPPEYLTGKKQIEKFNYIADMLLQLDIFTELDVDSLARYIMSEQLYLQYTNLLIGLIKSKDYDQMGKIQQLQDKAFRQCHQCARSLGLTITDRARLVVPQAPEEDDEL